MFYIFISDYTYLNNVLYYVHMSHTPHKQQLLLFIIIDKILLRILEASKDTKCPSKIYIILF